MINRTQIMLVKELIEELSKVDQEKPVVIPQCDLQEGRVYDVIELSDKEEHIIIFGE